MPKTPKKAARSNAPQYLVEWRDVADVKPYEDNPRSIPEHAVAQVAASIKRYGFRQPIVVDRAGVVVVGHTRLLAARQLGMDQVPVHVSDLSPAEARAYRIADNKTNEFSSWNFDALAAELRLLTADELSTLPLGFDQDELDKLLNETAPPSLDDLENQFGEHDDQDGWPVIKVRVPPDVKDMWDSTMAKAGDGRPEHVKLDRILHCVDLQSLSAYDVEDDGDPD